MVGTKREGIRGIEGREQRTICTSHVERLNGTQRLFMKPLNRLTYAFSKKLENSRNCSIRSSNISLSLIPHYRPSGSVLIWSW